MEITLTLNQILWIAIAIAVIIVLGYVVKLLKRLIETAERTNKVLADFEVVSKVVADKTEKLDGFADDLVAGLGVVSDMVKGNQSNMKAATNVVNAIAGIKNLMSEKDKEKKKK